MISARPYQDNAVNAIFDYYATGNTGNPVVAMPTASGKSVVIAKFVHKVLTSWPRQRFIVATHVKELIEQNHAKFLEAWPEAPAGIYSAGLNQKDTIQPIIFGGVQSMVNDVAAFGWRDLLLIDEAHLVSDEEDSNYQKLIAGLKAINPNLKVIGFTATPYRMGKGRISDGPIFTDICFDNTSLDAFNQLITDGYLCPLIPKQTKAEIDTSKVKITAGDFNKKQLEEVSDKDVINYAAVQEICEQGADRRSWLVFCTGLKHAHHIAELLDSMGIGVEVVSAKTPSKERARILADFKSYKLRCVVNVGVLTTGFDHPGLDLIAMLRPTASVVLWVQMLGRGTRPLYESGMPLDTVEQRIGAIQCSPKQNCLVLDFAGNTKRLGPINDPVIPRKKGEKGGGVAPIRICDDCGAYNHARATVCCLCGKEFPASPKITKFADTAELIRQTVEPNVEDWDVERVTYARHQKKAGKPILKINYFCKGYKLQPEYVCLEHDGIAGKKAKDWWRIRMGTATAPDRVDDALRYVENLKVPRQIKVWTNKKVNDTVYPEIVAAIF